MLNSRNYRRPALLIGVLAIAGAVAMLAHADALPAEEQAFFDKHVSDFVQATPTRFNDPSFLKVFSTPFYSVKLVIKQEDGDELHDLVVARIGDKLVNVSRPGSDTDLPDFPKMLNAAFRLKTDDDAKVLQHAMDMAYPILGDDDKKAEGIRHVGAQWMLIRGVFFDSKLGYIFEADADGVIKSVKFELKLP